MHQWWKEVRARREKSQYRRMYRNKMVVEGRVESKEYFSTFRREVSKVLTFMQEGKRREREE